MKREEVKLSGESISVDVEIRFHRIHIDGSGNVLVDYSIEDVRDTTVYFVSGLRETQIVQAAVNLARQYEDDLGVKIPVNPTYKKFRNQIHINMEDASN